MQNIIVAGSAHFDIIAKPFGDYFTIDAPGSIHLEAGGTGYNIACNLACLGTPVVFATTLKTSPLSDILLSKPLSLGVTVLCEFDDTLPTGGFSAHLDAHGELRRAVSDSPVAQGSVNSEELREFLKTANALILECNLSPRDLEALSLLASNARIPLIVNGVSEEKSIKLLNCHDIFCCFLNARELLYTLKQTHGSYCLLTPHEQLNLQSVLLVGKEAVDLTKAAQHFNCFIVVSDQDRGVYVASGAKTILVPAPSLSSPENMLGLGDLLLAATSHELRRANSFTYESLVHAVSQAMPTAGLISQVTQCNLGSRVQLDKELDKVSKQSQTDPLTGLLNRRGLAHETESKGIKAMLRKGTLSAIALDLDHFKHINDRYGHAFGDVVLAKVSEVLKECIRASDLAVRLGGEEFCVILAGETENIALSIAQRIRQCVAAIELWTPPLSSEVPEKVSITTSVGLAQAQAGEALQSLLGRADILLYQAKKQGRNRVVSQTATHSAI